MNIDKPYHLKIHCIEKVKMQVNFKTEEEAVNFLKGINDTFLHYDTFFSYSEQILIQKHNFILTFCGKENE